MKNYNVYSFLSTIFSYCLYNNFNCMAIIIGGVSAYFFSFGISSINAIVITSLIIIVGNYINNKITNKGGNISYENK